MKSSGLNFPAVYTITCRASGRVYVGQAVNLRKRWMSHRWHLKRRLHRNHHLQRAWLKYGAKAFVFEVAVRLEPNASREALAAAEAAVLASHPKSYNLMDPGASPVASAETRALRSRQQKEQWKVPGYRERVSASMKEAAADPELQRRRGDAISAAKSLPEQREKTSRESKARWADPTYKATLAQKRRDIWADPEHSAKQAAARKAAWADPEVRARRVAGLRATHARRRALKTSE